MNLFEAVKGKVTVREAAVSLGLKADGNGKVLCPFHDDRHPSMKLYDDHYYCFSCGAYGDVIDLTARATGLRPYDSAAWLAETYGVQTDIQPAASVQLNRQKEAQQFREKEKLCFSVLCDYFRLLKGWKARYPPESMGEEPDDRFAEACCQLEHTEYRLDILLDGSEEERRQLVSELMRDDRMTQLQERICRLQKEEQYVEKERTAG